MTEYTHDHTIVILLCDITECLQLKKQTDSISKSYQGLSQF